MLHCIQGGVLVFINDYCSLFNSANNLVLHFLYTTERVWGEGIFFEVRSCSILNEYILKILVVTVCGSRVLMNKHTAPMGFMVYFQPADKEKERLVICTHTFILCYYVILLLISVC
jgi:hypothetical protein